MGHVHAFQTVCGFLPETALGSAMSCERGVSIAWCQTHPVHVLRCGLVLSGGYQCLFHTDLREQTSTVVVSGESGSGSP